MPFPALIGLGIGLAGSIGKMFGRGKANKQLDTLLAKNPQYQENPLAKQQLGLATTLLNARMPGAAQAERNIYTNQANQFSGVQRNATDASQAIAAAAGISGQTNQAFTNLGMNEAQDYQRRYQNLVNAQQGAINEGDKVFQDKVRGYENEMAIRGAQQQNRQNNWGDVSNMGFALADFGMAGGFNNIFGGGNAPSNQSANLTGGTMGRTPQPNLNYNTSGISVPNRPLQFNAPQVMRPTPPNYNYNNPYYFGQ